MTDAPSRVTKEQFKELSIRLEIEKIKVLLLGKPTESTPKDIQKWKQQGIQKRRA